MPAVAIYPSPELPAHLKWQILSFIRVEWWWVFQGKNRFWDYTVKATNPVNVVVHEQDLVLSHAEINSRVLNHQGHAYKVYGMSAVFTYPSFRKEGYGKQAVQAATNYIYQSDADVAMLFCQPSLRAFYESCGWRYMPDTSVLYGNPDQPDRDEEEILLMLFVSEHGQKNQPQFESTPVYIGRYTW